MVTQTEREGFCRKARREQERWIMAILRVVLHGVEECFGRETP